MGKRGYFLVFMSFIGFSSIQAHSQVVVNKSLSVLLVDKTQARSLLVRSFMEGYKDVPLKQLNPEFESRQDVRRYYEAYFESELTHFKKGSLIWLEAFQGDKLVGWATFEVENSKIAYMNLLVVDPSYQGKGIGKLLTFSILREDLFPSVDEIRVLLRKVNQKGRKFYEKIGFKDFTLERKDHFVDMSLLSGLRWQKNI